MKEGLMKSLFGVSNQKTILNIWS